MWPSPWHVTLTLLMTCSHIQRINKLINSYDLDWMTLILKLDLDMVKMYLHTKTEVTMSRGLKVIAWTDRNTDRQTDRQTHRYDRKHYLPAYAGGKNKIQLVSKGTRIPGALRISWYHYLNGKNKNTKCLQSTSTCQNIDSLV